MTLDERIAASGKTTVQVAYEACISRQTLWLARTKPSSAHWRTAKNIAAVLGCRVIDVFPQYEQI